MLKHVCFLFSRQMSHTVYEEEYLGNFPNADSYEAGQVPLPLPTRAAAHQGLYLDADGNQLIGRAENGELPTLNT